MFLDAKGCDDVYCTQKLYMNVLIDIDLSYLSDERQLKHNLFFLTNSFRSAKGVAFNTVQSEILYSLKFCDFPCCKKHLNFSLSTWGLPDCDWELLALKRWFFLSCFNLFDLPPWLPEPLDLIVLSISVAIGFSEEYFIC